MSSPNMHYMGWVKLESDFEHEQNVQIQNILCIHKVIRLSLSRIPKDSLKHFEISVPRHIRGESEENNKLNNHI